jgi:hypothetical protein
MAACELCGERAAEYVVYCRCLEARSRLSTCGHCVPQDAVRRGDFGFVDPGAQCDFCADDLDSETRERG